jgi:hypothetical protein
VTSDIDIVLALSGRFIVHHIKQRWRTWYSCHKIKNQQLFCIRNGKNTIATEKCQDQSWINHLCPWLWSLGDESNDYVQNSSVHTERKYFTIL